MKLRIHRNSLRLRVSPSEVARLLETGRIEETIIFGAEEGARLTYALEHTDSGQWISLRYRPREIAVVLASDEARSWAEGEQVGIRGDLSAGNGRLELLVEKDFACLDRKDANNEDRFPNPKRGGVC